jgi:ADP-heptose:LPS heptosyltransferase
MPSIKPKTAISVFDILNSSASGRIIFLKLADRILGFFIILMIRMLLAFRPEGEVKVPREIKSLLIIRPGGIGDAVWVLPLIKLIKLKTGCSIDVLCERRNKAVFDLCPGQIRHIWMYDVQGMKLVNALTRAKYDCVIDTEQYHNFSAIFAYLTSSKCRIGFDTVPYRSRIYTHLVSYSHQAKEYKMFLDLFNALMPIKPQEYAQYRALDIPGTVSSVPQEVAGCRYITIFIGASVRERYWGSDKFAQLCQELVKMGNKVVLVGGREDLQKAREIKGLFDNDNIIDLVGKITLPQTAAVLKEGLGAVGADSGIMHLSCAVNCPSVWLFGAGIEMKWLPEFGKNESVNLHLDCSPCTLFGYTPRCPYDVRCLQEISVAQVVDKLRMIIIG